MELENMGVPKVFLSRLTANVLSEIYCLAVSRLLVHGAIDKLPVRVPDWYANPGPTDALVNENLQILSEPALRNSRSLLSQLKFRDTRS